MPNTNPIKIIDDGQYTVFEIPKKFSNKIIYISATSVMNEDNWKLHLIHALSVDGDPVNIQPNPDIVRQDIGTAKDLDAIQMALSTTISRIRNGGAGSTAPSVKYTLLFEADNDTIDTFDFTTDSKNPVTLYSKITFKMLS